MKGMKTCMIPVLYYVSPSSVRLLKRLEMNTAYRVVSN